MRYTKHLRLRLAAYRSLECHQHTIPCVWLHSQVPRGRKVASLVPVPRFLQNSLSLTINVGLGIKYSVNFAITFKINYVIFSCFLFPLLLISL